MLFQSLFTVLTVFAASLTTTDAAGSAGYTCEDWGIVPNTATLSATCMNSIGQGHSTSIPISNCVGNQNGVPGCQSKCAVSLNASFPYCIKLIIIDLNVLSTEEARVDHA